MDTPETPLPVLELIDGRLRLRPWQDHDAAGLYRAVHESMASVGQWLPWCRAEYAHDDATAWVEHCQVGWHAGEHFALPVFDASTGELLGGTGLNQLDRLHRSANLGYWIRQSRQREGIASAAAVLVARFGFEQLGLIRIEIIIQPDNHPSRRTAEKVGAKFEGIARHRLWVHEQPRDAAVYALVPDDLR